MILTLAVESEKKAHNSYLHEIVRRHNSHYGRNPYPRYAWVVIQTIDMDIDTLIATGATAKGGILCTAIGAVAYRYYMAMPHDRIVDRREVSHKVNLFDMDKKYAGAVTTLEILTTFAIED